MERMIKLKSVLLAVLTTALILPSVPYAAAETDVPEEPPAEVQEEENKDIVSFKAFRNGQEIDVYSYETEQGNVIFIENGTTLKFEKDNDRTQKFEYKFFYKDSEYEQIFFPEIQTDEFVFKAVKKGEFFIKVSRYDKEKDVTEEKIFGVVVTDGETSYSDTVLNINEPVRLNCGMSKTLALSSGTIKFIGSDSSFLQIQKISGNIISIGAKSAGTAHICIISNDGTARIATVNVRDCIMRTHTNDIVKLNNPKFTPYSISDGTFLQRKFSTQTGQQIIFSPVANMPSYTYEYFYQDEYGQDICIQPQSRNGNFKFTPIEPRKYVISVVVRDKTKNFIKKEIFTITATGKAVDTAKMIDTVEQTKTKTIVFPEMVTSIWKSNTNAFFAVSRKNVTYRGLNEGTTEFIILTESGRIYENYIKISPKMSEPFTLKTNSVLLNVQNTHKIAFAQKGDDTQFKYQSVDPSVASVSKDGVITALKAGTTEIVISNKINADKIKVTVNTTSIKLNTSSLELYTNNKAVLKPILDKGSNTSVSFSSSNTSVATVEQNGTVTAHKGGTAVITAKTANGKTASCTVTVMEIPNDVNISFKSVCPTVHVGETVSVGLNLSDSRYDKYVSVSVSDKTKASVSYSNGKCTIKGLETGKVILTASLPNGRQISTFFYSVGNYSDFRTNYAVEKGIDISCFNANVNYKKLKEEGYTFVIIRSGFGKELYQKDELFEKHIQGAKNAGLGIGIYHFCYAGNVAEAKREAQVCNQIIAKYRSDIKYGVFYDYEEDSIRYATKRGFAVNKSTVTNILVAFCEEIERCGFVAGVYGNTNEGRLYMDMNKIGKYMFWYAAPGATTFAFDFDIWQYSFWLRSPAFSGEADGDKIYSTVFQKLK